MAWHTHQYLLHLSLGRQWQCEWQWVAEPGEWGWYCSREGMSVPSLSDSLTDKTENTFFTIFVFENLYHCGTLLSIATLSFSTLGLPCGLWYCDGWGIYLTRAQLVPKLWSWVTMAEQFMGNIPYYAFLITFNSMDSINDFSNIIFILKWLQCICKMQRCIIWLLWAVLDCELFHIKIFNTEAKNDLNNFDITISFLEFISGPSKVFYLYRK